MKVAVVGSTGMVGQVMLKVLEERNFPLDELYPVASARSAGKMVTFKGKQYKVITLDEAVEKKPDIALFSAGASVSLEYAPKFAAVGTKVVDNSSAWRMDESVKLVIPEVNPHVLKLEDNIIANPNCSTIQMLVALAPLHRKYGIKRLVISTYQSISGTGVKAVQQMENERNGVEGEMAYPYPIDRNCLPHCDVFLENDYTKEEMKLVNETKKILEDDSINVTATAVRIPTAGGHSESVNIEFNSAFDVADVKKMMEEAPGIILQDNPSENIYPMCRFAESKNEVFVGRIRRDESIENGLNMWIVADNLRKGAATNTVQIAEYLLANNLC